MKVFMKIKDHIKSTSIFTHYRKGFLYYKTTDTKFTFRIPIEDTEDATFPAHEKSMTLMRYIRKELENYDNPNND